MTKTTVVFLVLLCAVLFLAGCDPTHADSFDLWVGVCIDTSDGSGVTAESASSLTSCLLPEVVHRRGRIRWYAMDGTRGTVLVGEFRAGVPARSSRAAILAFERRSIAEGERLFTQARAAVFSAHPSQSPLAYALSIMAADASEQRHEVKLYFLSDAREASEIADFECRPPSISSWLSRLQNAGALLPGTLQGVTVTFVGAPLLAPVPGNRCAPSLPRGRFVRELWKSAITAAGGQVVFVEHLEPKETVLFFFTGPLGFWRKTRVRLRAWRDRAKKRYAPRAIILELLGPKPGLDPTDPKHEHALSRGQTLQLLIAEASAQLEAVCDALTQYVRWIYPFTGVLLGAGAETAACIQVFTESGLRFPHNIVFGITIAAFVIIAIIGANKHADKTGTRPWWYQLVIIGLAVFVIAMTAVRITNATTGDQDWWEEASLGLVLLFGSVGPAIFSELCLHHLRDSLPLVRQRRVFERRLRQYQAELDTIKTTLSREAELRRSWEWEYEVYQATYDGINPPTTGSALPLHGGA